MGASESKKLPVTDIEITVREEDDWVEVTLDVFNRTDDIEMPEVAPARAEPTVITPVTPVTPVTVLLANRIIWKTTKESLSFFVHKGGQVTHILQNGAWEPLTAEHVKCPLPSRAAMRAAVRAAMSPSGRAMHEERLTFGGMSYEEWFEHAHFAAQVKRGLNSSRKNQRKRLLQY